MISVINYGNPVVNLHCLEYGAARQILERETYHERICLLAESVGAATLERQDPQAPRPAEK